MEAIQQSNKENLAFIQQSNKDLSKSWDEFFRVQDESRRIGEAITELQMQASQLKEAQLESAPRNFPIQPEQNPVQVNAIHLQSEKVNPSTTNVEELSQKFNEDAPIIEDVGNDTDREELKEYARIEEEDKKRKKSEEEMRKLDEEKRKIDEELMKKKKLEEDERNKLVKEVDEKDKNLEKDEKLEVKESCEVRKLKEEIKRMRKEMENLKEENKSLKEEVRSLRKLNEKTLDVPISKSVIDSRDLSFEKSIEILKNLDIKDHFEKVCEPEHRKVKVKDVMVNWSGTRKKSDNGKWDKSRGHCVKKKDKRKRPRTRVVKRVFSKADVEPD